MKSASIDDAERIVVTGIGIVSSVGIGRKTFWESIVNGKSGIKKVTLFDTSTLESKLGAEISEFKPEDILSSKGLRTMDRTTTLALCASKLAIEDAGLQISETNSDRIGVVLGSTMGSVWSISEFDKEGMRSGPKSLNPALFPNTVMNSPASHISIAFGIRGFNSTISTGLTSAIEAIGYARCFLLRNRADIVLVGGVEELCEHIYKGCYKVGFNSRNNSKQVELCAPYDKRRNGIILGEGAAMLVMESMASAKKRNAKISGELMGVSSFYDRRSYNKYNLRGSGASVAISKVLLESGLDTGSVSYIAASANSTIDGDIAETRALKKVFGKSKNLVASASKSMLGETFSASGAFQIASALCSLSANIIPPTINYEEHDQNCELDCVPNKAREAQIDNVLITSLSPMGQNAAAIIARN